VEQYVGACFICQASSYAMHVRWYSRSRPSSSSYSKTSVLKATNWPNPSLRNRPVPLSTRCRLTAEKTNSSSKS
jgi:hypothetical protein